MSELKKVLLGEHRIKMLNFAVYEDERGVASIQIKHVTPDSEHSFSFHGDVSPEGLRKLSMMFLRASDNLESRSSP